MLRSIKRRGVGIFIKVLQDAHFFSPFFFLLSLVGHSAGSTEVTVPRTKTYLGLIVPPARYPTLTLAGLHQVSFHHEHTRVFINFQFIITRKDYEQTGNYFLFKVLSKSPEAPAPAVS